MSTSIYNISAWSSNTIYHVHDIVSRNNKYYYCLANNTAGTFETDLQAGLWGGYVIDQKGNEKPYFLWKPTYNSNSNIQPFVKNLKFGDGYEQRTPAGINNVLMDFDLTFEARSLAETTAILHFFTARAGWESFYFIPPAPYDTRRLFVSRSWQHTFEFYDNHSIKTRFEEVVF